MKQLPQVELAIGVGEGDPRVTSRPETTSQSRPITAIAPMPDDTQVMNLPR
jgi:hypothetical protein